MFSSPRRSAAECVNQNNEEPEKSSKLAGDASRERNISLSDLLLLLSYTITYKEGRDASDANQDSADVA